MAAADVALVRRHPADVVAVAAGKVVVVVIEAAAHLVGVLLVYAEDNGLGEAVGLAQELSQVSCNDVSAGAQGHHALEVPGLVLVVEDGAAEAVNVADARPPARAW
jgi:hypothetical protein